MVYLSTEEVISQYDDVVKRAREWFAPFDRYERLAGNKISKSISRNMPRVNDGSLAASLIETPMQVLPNMQSGKFTSENLKDKWVNELVNLIWKNKIVPNANTQATFFDKEQIALYRALKYGAQPRYNFYVSTEKYTGSDWSLPYVKNVKLEPGKFSVDDCNYVYMDVYYTKQDLKRMIGQIEADTKKAKADGTKLDTSWNIKSLKDLVNLALSDKEIEEQNINEREKHVQASGIKITACFQRGIGAPFLMFSKHLGVDKPIREWKNPDPTGDLPITMQYCFENLETPYGIGRVELAGPTQEVLDYMTQAHVLATQIGLQPVKKVKGPIDGLNLNSITHRPDGLWIVGNADVEVVQNTTGVYAQFPANFGLYKAQLQNLQGRTDGSVSSQSGDPGFSKTQAGVQMQETRTNAQDNYLRNKSDTASAKMAEKMMNVHLAMSEGADIIDVAEEDVERLYNAGFFDDDPETTEVPSIDDVPFQYEQLQDTFKFKYDPRPEADEDEKERWLELVDIATSNPNLIPALEQSGWRFNLGEAFKRVIGASGAQDWEKVLTPITAEEQAMAQQQQMMQEGQMQPDMQGEQPMDPQMAQEPMQQPMPTDWNDQMQQELEVTMQEYGVPEDAAKVVMMARRMDYPEEEIAAYLTGGNQ